VEVEIDEQHSLTDKGDNKNSSRDSHHQKKKPYSLARSNEKHDKKAPERYDFEDVVSFALVANIGDPSSIQDGMTKEVELLQKAKRCRWIYRKKLTLPLAIHSIKAS